MNFKNLAPTRVQNLFQDGELQSMFQEMTKDVFQSSIDVAKIGTLFVQVSTNISNIKADGELDNKPEGHSTFEVLQSTDFSSGRLSHCRQQFSVYGTSFEWYHFVHKDISTYWAQVKNRLTSGGVFPTHEWWFSYMYPDAHFQKHVDGNEPWLRYSVVVDQPPTETSIRFGDEFYRFESGDAYVMDGEVPHEVKNGAKHPRLMFLGSVVGTPALFRNAPASRPPLAPLSQGDEAHLG